MWDFLLFIPKITWVSPLCCCSGMWEDLCASAIWLRKGNKPDKTQNALEQAELTGSRRWFEIKERSHRDQSGNFPLPHLQSCISPLAALIYRGLYLKHSMPSTGVFYNLKQNFIILKIHKAQTLFYFNLSAQRSRKNWYISNNGGARGEFMAPETLRHRNKQQHFSLFY